MTALLHKDGSVLEADDNADKTQGPPQGLSLSHRVWVEPDTSALAPDPSLCERLGVSERVLDIVMQRDMTTQDAIENFLKPKLKNLLPDPFALKDVDKGVDAVILAIESSHTIGIFGDYDVDGATSTALLKNYMTAIDAQSTVYIPDRLQEGYGPNKAALKHLYDQGIRLVIIVDCGTTSFEPLAYAKELGLQVIVIDHHLGGATLPDVTALINPNRLDEQDNDALAPYLRSLCAAGMTFLFLVALQKKLRERGFFNTREEPNLFMYLDLVALGTVCDVMPLTYLNRAFVQMGLQVMKSRNNPGLSTLMDVANCASNEISAYHLGFVIGPRINAGGRVGESSLGTRLLSYDVGENARDISIRLNTLNQERQALEAQILEQAYERVESERLYDKPVVIVDHTDWHPGVIGIVASRLKERYQKPTLVISFQQDPLMGKGSGRSVPGVSLGDALHKAVNLGLLAQGGGHAMAAGLTVAREKLHDFQAFLWDTLASDVASYQPSYMVSGSLNVSDVTLDRIDELSILEPFGQGNSAPKFRIGPVRIMGIETFGRNHMRLNVMDHMGSVLKVTQFSGADTSYVDVLHDPTRLFYLLGTLKKNTWNRCDTAHFYVDDIVHVS